jgi:hypothetical protein
MFGGLEKEDVEGFEKILDKIIKKTKNSRDRMQAIEEDSLALKEAVGDNTKKEEPGEQTDDWRKLYVKFNRVQLIALISLVERFLYASRQDNQEISGELEDLNNIKRKLKQE